MVEETDDELRNKLEMLVMVLTSEDHICPSSPLSSLSSQPLTALSSLLQAVFDALCPVESVRSRRRLCVVLVTQNDPSHDPSRAALREYAMSDQARERDRVRYTYLFREKQVEFMNALTSGGMCYELLMLYLINRKRKKYCI